MSNVLPTALFSIWIAMQMPQSVLSKSAKATIREFWSLELSGGRLTEEGWNRASAFFQNPSPWSPGQTLIVVSDKYLIDELKSTPKTADIYVGCDEVGSIDSAFRFKRSLTGARAVCKFKAALNERGEWKIVEGPPGLRVSVDAALKYVTGMQNRITDTATQNNSEQTIASLKALRKIDLTPTPLASHSPSRIAHFTRKLAQCVT